MFEPYEYIAYVRSIYDGDTIKVDIDLGFNTWIKNMGIRLYGIDTPEIRGEERPDGLISKEFVLNRIPIGSKIYIQTIKDKTGKYGRYLGIIYYGDPLNLINLNEELVANGLAEEYK